MSHTSFIDIAARIGQIIRYTEEHLVQANRWEREFSTFSHTVHSFESLQELRLDLQSVIQRRSNEQYESFRDLLTDVVALNVSQFDKHQLLRKHHNTSKNVSHL